MTMNSKAGASFEMPPPCALVLFYFVLFLLCFPLGKFPLSFHALEKRLNFAEQDTGWGRPRTCHATGYTVNLLQNRILKNQAKEKVGENCRTSGFSNFFKAQIFFLGLKTVFCNSHLC